MGFGVVVFEKLLEEAFGFGTGLFHLGIPDFSVAGNLFGKPEEGQDRRIGFRVGKPGEAAFNQTKVPIPEFSFLPMPFG